MVNCPYLIYEASHCAGCTGWACQAFGRKKRLSDTSMCVVNEEWLECPRYTAKIEKVTKSPDPIPVVKLDEGIGVVSLPGKKIPESVAVERAALAPPPGEDCPYLGPVPLGEVACCGFWCHANNTPIRTTTACKSPPTWRECPRSFRAGVN